MTNIKKYERVPNKTFIELYPNATDDDLSIVENFLYHSILVHHSVEIDGNCIMRDPYEILENIFKQKNILALKYLKGFIDDYKFNVNDGEYVSLLSLDKNQSNYDHLYKSYIEQNISLVVSPFVNAIKTIYIEHYFRARKKNPNLKNRYSILPGEYQVKDNIPLDLVVAVGVPYSSFENRRGLSFANNSIDKVNSIIDSYGVNLPIVDTSNNNKLLIKKK